MNRHTIYIHLIETIACLCVCVCVVLLLLRYYYIVLYANHVRAKPSKKSENILFSAYTADADDDDE